MVVSGSPKMVGSVAYNPQEGKEYKWYIYIYKWYILPIGGLYATYHPLKEPETNIELCWVFVICCDYDIALKTSEV